MGVKLEKKLAQILETNLKTIANRNTSYQRNKVVTLLVRQKPFVQKNPTARGVTINQS